MAARRSRRSLAFRLETVKKIDAYKEGHPDITIKQVLADLGLVKSVSHDDYYRWRALLLKADAVRKANETGKPQHFPLEAIPARERKAKRSLKKAAVYKTNDDKDVAMLLLEAATRLLKRS